VRLAWVELTDFRNHAHTELTDLPDGPIVVVGPNGEGKTNLLEGMYFLFALTSERASSSQPLVRDGAEAAFARGEVETRDGRVLIEIEIPPKGASRLQVNRSPLRRKRNLKQQVRAVFFGPDDLDVVRGDPSQRRRFMDEAVATLWPVKASAATAYEKALRQRNRLLKEHEGRGLPRGIEAWDEELVDAGSALIRARAEAVESLAPHASEDFLELATYELACTYAPNLWDDGWREGSALEEAFRARIEERRSDELVRRTSLVGPHRDDLALAVRDLGARNFGSHGEGWAAALCLRLGLSRAVAAEVGEPPVILLDDPFSALDPARQERAAGRLRDRGQVIVSVADESHVPARVDRIYAVSAGTVKMG
jgi:DNA replication and repair protein RecF